ncbi:RNA-directed DNA polymerase from mobile element jockey-like [Brachionus plicatilis]|uniref:RNA-directed DNA polymerase from mobile element jockey-like n=1 Tax=Brachionus plicatilis TaxID=10195 RepID=A0A3M7PFF0_BRAPC|nr:RNA-directed DNA polymerase from mobile element jockey-like [Brachionus plicatilis]
MNLLMMHLAQNKKSKLRQCRGCKKDDVDLKVYGIRTKYESFKKVDIITLESRRSRGDLISHYKIANGLLDVNWLASTKLMSSIACQDPANAIRGHKKRLFVQLSNCPARTNFLNNRVASTWSNLASSIVNAPTLNGFKARLDIYLARTNTTTTYFFAQNDDDKPLDKRFPIRL